MLYLVAFVVAAGVGFAGSRMLRRPTHVAQAASVARSVSGSLGGRRGLDAPELQRACFSEMVRHVRVDRSGRTHAPSEYLFRLNPGDLAVVDEARRWFTDGLAGALRDAAAQNGWKLSGPVKVDYEADPARRPGVPSAVVVGADRALAAAATSRGLALVRGDDGSRLELGRQPVTIGRSPENTITSVDERISRAHARIEPAGSGWVVVDLRSANGTRVDGKPVSPGSPVPLAAGSVVGIGPLELRVVPGSGGSGGAGAAGTRALDDSERTRISAEVLGGGTRERLR